MSLAEHGINLGVYPVGGTFRYEQAHEGATVVMESDDGESLVDEVRQFRARCQIPIGDVEREVADFIKSYSTISDRFPGETVLPDGFSPAPKDPLPQRLIVWLISLIARKPGLVREDIAGARCDACSGCGFNLKPEPSALSPQIKDRGLQLRQRATWGNDSTANACVLHDLWLPAALFVERDHLPAPNKRSPENCFLRTP